ncbi:hypothetical protein [Dyadobacter sp. 676]|uniref:PepSY domain-containing protein n=1 Tax=Dyadobacter sp. 676 TaxID=3088362 RepID=A0AAU8FNV4_9BACT
MWLNAAAAWTLPLISLPGWGPVEVQSKFDRSIPKVIDKLPQPGHPIVTIQPERFEAATAAVPPMSVAGWIMAIYLAGVVILAARFLYRTGRLCILVRKKSHRKMPRRHFHRTR